jgi:hypothetical protein
LINFPIDQVGVQVEDFGQGESANFFKAFNGEDKEFSKLRKSLTLFGTIFDLATLPSLTSSNVTKEVTIKADTVYISGPVHLNYYLKIRARVVSIAFPITMSLTNDQFSQANFRTRFEKHVRVNPSGLVMRHRKAGLLDILDQVPDESAHQASICTPALYNATEAHIDTSDWFDPVVTNLGYVCARTVLPTYSNTKLAVQMANFNLDYHNNKEVVGDTKTFVTAQKFKRIIELGKTQQIHNVPTYSMTTIKELSELMYNRLSMYRYVSIAAKRSHCKALSLQGALAARRSRCKALSLQGALAARCSRCKALSLQGALAARRSRCKGLLMQGALAARRSRCKALLLQGALAARRSCCKFSCCKAL